MIDIQTDSVEKVIVSKKKTGKGLLVELGRNSQRS